MGPSGPKENIMKKFNEFNTEGYTDEELHALNEEWDERVHELELEPHTDEYEEEYKRFSDEIARR